VDKHKSALCSFGISILSLYWIPKFHECHYKQSYFAGSAKRSTRHLKIINIYSINRPNRVSELRWY